MRENRLPIAFVSAAAAMVLALIITFSHRPAEGEPPALESYFNDIGFLGRVFFCGQQGANVSFRLPDFGVSSFAARQWIDEKEMPHRLVIVATRQEARGFVDDPTVLVAWPSTLTLGMIDEMNLNGDETFAILSRRFEEFHRQPFPEGANPPITAQDIVEDLMVARVILDLDHLRGSALSNSAFEAAGTTDHCEW